MPSFLRPRDAVVRAALDGLTGASPNYPRLGRTFSEAAEDGFVRDRYVGELGSGRAVYERACAGLSSFAMMPAWTQVRPATVTARAGVDVAIIVRVAGLWWVNPTRIIAVISERGEKECFGFTYGTLPGHAERGEERFLVSWNRIDDVVTYEIVADSRPRHWLARLFRPLARATQSRFGRDSVAALQRYVGNTASTA